MSTLINIFRFFAKNIVDKQCSVFNWANRFLATLKNLKIQTGEQNCRNRYKFLDELKINWQKILNYTKRWNGIARRFKPEKVDKHYSAKPVFKKFTLTLVTHIKENLFRENSN